MSYNETVFEIEGNRANWTVSTGHQIWKNRLMKLAEEHPEDVVVKAVNKDGSMLFHVPREWLTIRPPVKLNISDERRAELSEQMRRIRNQEKDLAE